MAYIVRMPKLGLEMEEGTVTAWHLEEGEAVTADSVLAEIESEKTTAEVEAREDGVLRAVYLSEGETVEPGTPMGVVADPDADIADLEAEARGDLEGSAEAAPDDTAAPATDAAESTDAADSDDTADAGSEDVKATPRATKRAEELGVSLASVDGSGPSGAVTAEDVEAAGEAAASEPATETTGATRTVAETVEFGGMRRTIAKRLSESYREAVHVTEHRKAAASELFDAADAAEAALDTDVSVSDVLVLALSAALDDHPAFNATFEDGVHRIYEEHNVAVAVDVDAGLVTPVLPDVGNRSLPDLAEARRALTQKTLDGDYTTSDLSGGTFTVTNLGVLGVESFDPIINPPQVAILGVNAPVERARTTDAGGVDVRELLPLDLSFDHRVVDGADAARFLDTLVGHVEDPWPLLPGAVDRGSASGIELPGRQVTARTPGGLSGTVDAGSFAWQFGDEDAPDPVALFAGSLAACLSASVGYQFQMRGVDVDGVDVDVTASPETGSVESLRADVTVDAPESVDDDVLSRAVENGEKSCHVAELLRDDLPMELSWTRT
jgi:pyruvate dehydrogenase E2 component (dihydrolipoamide acetyltransferase)